MTVRPATAADIAAWAKISRYMEQSPTLLAWVGEIDGRLVAMGGIGRNHAGRWFGFIDMEDEARPHKMTIARSAIRFLAEAKRRGVRHIYAEVSPHEPGARRWLERLGFRFDERSQHYLIWSA